MIEARSASEIPDAVLCEGFRLYSHTEQEWIALNVKQIRYFVSSARFGSFSEAAKDQYVSVQAISKAILDLERELDSELFVRGSRGVSLTPFGARFLRKAEKTLANFEDLESTASGSAISTTDDLVNLALCLPPFFSSNHVRGAIQTFIERYLHIEVNVFLGDGRACHDLLHDHQVDAFVSLGPVPDNTLTEVPLGTIAPAVLMPRNHPYVKKATVTVKELAKYPFNVPRSFDYFYDAVMAGYARNPDFPPVVEADKSTTRMLAFFAKGGMSMVPCISGLGELFPGAIMRPVAEEDAIAIPLFLNYLKGSERPALMALGSLFRGEISGIDLGGGAVSFA